MNILDFLSDDHLRIRGELLDLKKNFYDADLISRLKQFGSHFSLHEALEEEILFKSVRSRLDPLSERRIKYLEADRANVADRFARLLEAANCRSAIDCRDDFAALFEFVMWHMKEEELSVFPKIRETIEADDLSDLGLRAERQFYSRYKPLEIAAAK